MAYNDTQATMDQFFLDVGGNTNTNFRIKAGVFQLKNTTDGKFHTAWVADIGGDPTLQIAETGEV